MLFAGSPATVGGCSRGDLCRVPEEPQWLASRWHRGSATAAAVIANARATGTMMLKAAAGCLQQVHCAALKSWQVVGTCATTCRLLQGPLASLDLSAHVLYRITRARLAGNFLAFSLTSSENAVFRAELKDRLALLCEEYSTLLYGGKMLLAVSRGSPATGKCKTLFSSHRCSASVACCASGLSSTYLLTGARYPCRKV
jgi:hypothetical protein